MKPCVLCIFPPVYDFALYDLYLKPYSLLRLGKWFECCGYRVKLLNCLDYREQITMAKLGRPRRKADGTGKFFRRIVEKPAVLAGIPRNFARYGLLQQVVRREIAAARPDLILVASGMTYWYQGVQEVVTAAREIFPRVPVIVGGTYATLCPDHCRQVVPADYIISGPAFPRLAGILAELRLPCDTTIPLDSPLLLAGIYSEAAVVRINNGCPFHCRYCSSHALAGDFVPGDPAAAFRLVERIHSRLGTRIFAFYDDALLADREEVFIPFLEKIVDSGMQLHFYLPNAIHMSFMDEKTAGLMQQAGFRELRIGFESSRSRFHTSYDRKLDPGDFHAKIRLLLTAGFKPSEISLYILAGLPGQEKEEVEESIHFAARFRVNVYIAQYSPVPGSGLWEKSVALSCFPLVEEPLTHNNSILPLRWEGFTSADLQSLKDLSLRLCRQQDK